MCAVGKRGRGEVVIVVRVRVRGHVGKGRGVVRGLRGDGIELLVLAVVLDGPAHGSDDAALMRLATEAAGVGSERRRADGMEGGRKEQDKQVGVKEHKSSVT